MKRIDQSIDRRIQYCEKKNIKLLCKKESGPWEGREVSLKDGDRLLSKSRYGNSFPTNESAKISAAIERNEGSGGAGKLSSKKFFVGSRNSANGRTRHAPDQGKKSLGGQSSLWSAPRTDTKRGNNQRGFFREPIFPHTPLDASIDPFILAASQQVWNYIG